MTMKIEVCHAICWLDGNRLTNLRIYSVTPEYLYHTRKLQETRRDYVEQNDCGGWKSSVDLRASRGECASDYAKDDNDWLFTRPSSHSLHTPKASRYIHCSRTQVNSVICVKYTNHTHTHICNNLILHNATRQIYRSYCGAREKCSR